MLVKYKRKSYMLNDIYDLYDMFWRNDDDDFVNFLGEQIREMKTEREAVAYEKRCYEFLADSHRLALGEVMGIAEDAVNRKKITKQELLDLMHVILDVIYEEL